MRINFFDDGAWFSLRPLSLTRPVADLRLGILTIAEKWRKYLDAEGAGFKTAAYLAVKYPLDAGAPLFINGSVCPNDALLQEVSGLIGGEALKKDDLLIAYRVQAGDITADPEKFAIKKYTGELTRIAYPEDIFKYNGAELRLDFELLTKGRTSARLSGTNTFIGDLFFAEEGAEAECSTFNSKQGPIYIGARSQVWEGSHIRGPFALCHDAQVKMGAKIYGQTTIGPFSRVGGEINNAVIWGCSSKGHDGYLGNSVMGQWCNIGADSNNSNLKNNYSEVKLWDYRMRSFRKTGLQFCGLIMGDHTKCGINTMFNTGTVAGVAANVFGAGLPPNFIPDFSWGGAQGFETYRLEKLFETTEKVFERKGEVFNQTERDILTHIFEETKTNRA